MDAFLQGFGKEQPAPGLIVHTDQGSQFTGGKFTTLVTRIPEHLYQWGRLNSERLIEKSLFVGDLSYPKPMPRMGIAFDDIELIEQIM